MHDENGFIIIYLTKLFRLKSWKRKVPLHNDNVQNRFENPEAYKTKRLYNHIVGHGSNSNRGI